MRNSAEELRVIEGEGEAPSRPADPLIGKTIDGRYLIERLLGEGGMGLVYKAKHTILGKALAIKVLRHDVSKDEEIMTRFRQEAQSASAIGNQHIIDISDFGTMPDGSTYFVMEFLDGTDLTSLIDDPKPVPSERVIRIAKQLCRALGAAHKNGIVHRDMKPDNIYLISRNDDCDFTKVLDFGIAKVGGSGSKLTKAGQVFGTPHYMSPEQCAGRDVDHRTDIYAVGVIMYELATGAVPFDAENLMGILTKHLYEEAIPPLQQDPPADITEDFESVILKCLVKDKEERFQSMDEVFADLERVEQGAMPAAGTGVRRRDTKSLSGSMMGVLGGVLLAGGIGAAVFAFTDNTTTLPRNSALATQPGTEPAIPGHPTDEAHASASNRDEQIADPSAEVAAPVALVVIQSIPAGAEVWRGDVLIGNTPVSIPKPSDGESYDFELRRSGYTPWPVRVSSLTQSEVTVQLEQETPEGRRPRSNRPEPRLQRPSTETRMTPGAGMTPGRVTNGTRMNDELLDPWGMAH